MTEAFDKKRAALELQRQAVKLDIVRMDMEADRLQSVIAAMDEAKQLLAIRSEVNEVGPGQQPAPDVQQRHPVKRMVQAYLSAHPEGASEEHLLAHMASHHSIPAEATQRYLKRALGAGELVLDDDVGRYFLPATGGPGQATLDFIRGAGGRGVTADQLKLVGRYDAALALVARGEVSEEGGRYFAMTTEVSPPREAAE